MAVPQFVVPAFPNVPLSLARKFGEREVKVKGEMQDKSIRRRRYPGTGAIDSGDAARGPHLLLECEHRYGERWGKMGKDGEKKHCARILRTARHQNWHPSDQANVRAFMWGGGVGLGKGEGWASKATAGGKRDYKLSRM